MTKLYRDCKRCATAKKTSDFYETSGNANVCKQCVIKRSAEWTAKNPERRKEIANKWSRKNTKARVMADTQKRRADPEKFRAQHLRRRFWPHLSCQEALCEYDKILVKQDNACAICKQTFSKTPHVDHNHRTGKVRGVLCGPCNRGIGYLKDSPDVCASAALYLGTKLNEYCLV